MICVVATCTPYLFCLYIVDATTMKMACVPWDMDMRALIGENMSIAVMATEKIWTLFPLIQSMNACIGNCFPGANATSQAFYTVQNMKKAYKDCLISFRTGKSSSHTVPILKSCRYDPLVDEWAGPVPWLSTTRCRPLGRDFPISHLP